MIKQVYLVTYNERFGCADTLEKAKALESQFMASFNGEPITSLRHKAQI